MSDLYMSDVFRIFHNYEPSRIRLWEIARTYDPIQFAALIYLVENVSKSTKRPVMDLPEEEYINGFASTTVMPATNKPPTLNLAYPEPQLDRVKVDVEDFFDAAASVNDIHHHNIGRHKNDYKIVDMVKYICNKALHPLKRNMYIDILEHNLGTVDYAKFVQHIQYLLLPDNLHCDRNGNGVHYVGSTVTRFLQFVKMMQFKYHEVDPRNCRFIMTPKPVRIYEKPWNCEELYVVQPLYNGFSTIIYSTPSETRCYNRYGELIPNLLYGSRFNAHITFEAIILPMDIKGFVRSWRYWPYKNDYVIIPVDVFRYDQNILTDVPFVERQKYIKRIKGKHIRNHYLSDANTSSWNEIKRNYDERADIYNPIVGIILREKNHTMISHRRHCEYRFPILISFNLKTLQIVRLKEAKDEDVKNLHYNYEMSDHRKVAVAYGHDENYYYLCSYDRFTHQFKHAAKLERLPYDVGEPTYKPESIYVICSETQCRGVCYLRIYYNKLKNVIGYETKHTTSKFDVPKQNQFLPTY